MTGSMRLAHELPPRPIEDFPAQLKAATGPTHSSNPGTKPGRAIAIQKQAQGTDKN